MLESLWNKTAQQLGFRFIFPLYFLSKNLDVVFTVSDEDSATEYMVECLKKVFLPNICILVSKYYGDTQMASLFNAVAMIPSEY